MIAGDAGLLRKVHDVTIVNASRVSFAELRARMPLEPLFAVSEAVKQEMPFQIVFTSGTTSVPKGIVHTHRNVLVTADRTRDAEVSAV